MYALGRELSARKGDFGGLHRTRDAAATLADYGRFMPLMGITRIANVTGLDRIGVPVCVAIRPNSRALATSQGKGDTVEAAKASALMESIEAWHGERIRAPLVHESWHTLAERARVVDPSELPVRADATLHPNRPLTWIAGWDLLQEAETWVPYELVSTNFVDAPGQVHTFLQSSNGLASGNHLLEALIHGLLEVIERDAVSISKLYTPAERKARQVDLGSIHDPYLVSLLRRLDERGVVAGVWDVTSDIGVPTFTCTILENPDSPEWRPIGAFSGHGAHLKPEIALARALHEAIQSRVTVISGSRDDVFPRDYEDAGIDHARQIAELSATPATRPFSAAGALPLSDWLEDDLATLLTRLRDAGVRSVVAVDLSLPEIAIPVVKVVVPGLEPFHTSLYRPGPRALRRRVDPS